MPVSYTHLDVYKRQQLSYHDSLTGLLNRNRYMQDFDSLSEQDEPIGVVFLDINGMKEVNDRDGHAVGDRLLIECAKTMRTVLGDAFSLYRIGGDEFVAIAVGIGESEFTRLSTELGGAFEDDSLCHVAIGARWEEHPKNISEMLFEADEDVYKRQALNDSIVAFKPSLFIPASEATSSTVSAVTIKGKSSLASHFSQVSGVNTPPTSLVPRA